MKPERVNDRERIKQKDRQQERDAGVISNASESYICPAAGKCSHHEYT